MPEIPLILLITITSILTSYFHQWNDMASLFTTGFFCSMWCLWGSSLLHKAVPIHYCIALVSSHRWTFPAGDIWLCLETFLVAVIGGLRVAQWVEARNVPEHSIMHRTTPAPRPGQGTNCSKMSTVLKLRNSAAQYPVYKRNTNYLHMLLWMDIWDVPGMWLLIK